MMIGLVSWLLTGLLVGVAGRLLLPGPPPSWVATVALALAGALGGGLLATLLEMGGVAELDPRAVVLALLSALLTTVVYQLLRVVRDRDGD